MFQSFAASLILIALLLWTPAGVDAQINILSVNRTNGTFTYVSDSFSSCQKNPYDGSSSVGEFTSDQSSDCAEPFGSAQGTARQQSNISSASILCTMTVTGKSAHIGDCDNDSETGNGSGVMQIHFEVSSEVRFSFFSSVVGLTPSNSEVVLSKEGSGPFQETIFQTCSSPDVCPPGPTPPDNGTLAPGTYWLSVYSNGKSSSGSNCPDIQPAMSGSASLNLDMEFSPLLSLQLHRGSSLNAFTNAEFSTDVDEQLTPTADPTILANEPTVTGGLVADGVTPLLLEFRSAVSSATPYKISLDNFQSKLFVLSDGEWQQGNTITVAPSGSAFAYLAAVDPTEVGTSPERVVNVTLTDDSQSIAVGSFKVRKPPIFLVHGYYSDANTWSQKFLDELKNIGSSASKAGMPSGDSSDFIRKINYGVISLNGSPLSFLGGIYPNTYGALIPLAGTLDAALSVDETLLKKDWAFTRYDVIAHSQGGVLTRMLCAKTPFPGVQPFSGPANFNRGRFRRMVMIGAPQNGSRFVRFLLREAQQTETYGAFPTVLKTLGILQSKFDPFGEQIRSINDPSRTIDPGARFALISSTIEGGHVPFGNVPLCYAIAGLTQADANDTSVSRGSIVIPRGSDGVVDPDSQEASPAFGSPVNMVTKMGFDICHALIPTPIFWGVGPGEGETSEPQVAVTAANLLNGPATNFGSFYLPTLLGEADKAQIDGEVPIASIFDIIESAISFENRTKAVARHNPASVNSYGFTLNPDPSEPIEGSLNWFAEVFGPNGVTTDGVTATNDPSNPEQVTVSVDSSVIGTVVLYSSYNSTTGKLILAKPKVIVSIAPNGATLTGVTLYPTDTQATVGDMIGAQLWGSYSDGTTSQLYIPMDMSVQFASSNPNVVSVSPDGLIQAKTAGNSTLTVSYQGLTTQTTITVTAPFATAALGNISTRLEVGTGDNALIGGFIVTGTQAKKVIVRGLGPSLPVSNGLVDSILELHDSTGATVASNDDWRDTQQADIIATTIPPTNDLESAIVMSLSPGAYTAIVRGKQDTTGVGLVEVYDLDQTVDSKLANISTRGFVDMGDNVMIGGTIVTGTGPANVLIRAIGPSLALSGVANALQDPTLELHDGQGNVIASNDNWQDTQADAIQATTIPPTDPRESAILQSLAPGAYTAIVRGAEDTTGVALVEAYQLP